MTEIVEGVYLEKISQIIGTAGTSRKQEIANYYLAKPIDAGTIQIQILDMEGNPMSIVEKVDLDEFLRRFTFQPDFYKKQKSTQNTKINRVITQAEAHLNRKEYFSAEYEYGKALKLDEDNVRANFGMGKVYLATGEIKKAKATFKKLTNIDAIFEEENKHIFNELGMELRRLQLFDQAINYYRKALSFTRDDENLYFNIGRALFEKGDWKRARQLFMKSLSLNPGLAEARLLLERIEQKSGA